MSRISIRYFSLWMVDGSDDGLLPKLKAYLIACARYAETYEGQSLMLPERMNVRHAIDRLARQLGLEAVEVKTPVGGLPLLACSRQTHELALLLPKGPHYFLVSGTDQGLKLIHAHSVHEHYKECIQLFRSALQSDINHQASRYFPKFLSALIILAKSGLLALALVCSILMLFETNINQFLLLISGILALKLTVFLDICLKNQLLQNKALVRLLALAQVFIPVFRLDLERYAHTTWAQITRLCAQVGYNASDFMAKTPELIWAVLVILINFPLLYVFDVRAGISLTIILGLVAGLSFVLKARLDRLAHRARLLDDELDKSLSAFRYSFSMAVGLKVQAPMLRRLYELSQNLRAKTFTIKRLRMVALWLCMLMTLNLLILVLSLAADRSLIVILFLVVDISALGLALNHVTQFMLKPFVPLFDANLLAELASLSPKPHERVQPVNISGAIEMHDVSFAYPDAGALVIKNASLSIEAQKFYALVGPSGSGKSTLLKLLAAEEIAEDGQVVFDGQDARSLDLTLLHKHFGVVNQDSRPFAGSIASNIVCGRDIAARNLEQVLYSHEIFDLLLDLPMGLETYVFDRATNISRLQTVVLLLARALVHQPKILFLDEIFKGIGPDQQALIIDYLHNLPITRVLVTHDLSPALRPDYMFLQNDWHRNAHKNF